MGYEAVLFDLDDTLYPYPPRDEAGTRAGFDTFRELGYELDRAAFDVTPPRYMDAIVTEHGQFPAESIVTRICEPFGEGIDEPGAEP